MEVLEQAVGGERMRADGAHDLDVADAVVRHNRAVGWGLSHLCLDNIPTFLTQEGGEIEV